MNPARKIIGLLIIVFIAIPSILAIIWSVGLTKAVVSPEFLSDLPKEVITKVPDFVDDMLESMLQEDVITDENTRKWLQAIKETDTSFKDLLKRIGILDWLENELSESFNNIGKILRGEMQPEPIMLDLRPLKKVLKGEAITLYIEEILTKLPPCNDDELRIWQESAIQGEIFKNLPACRPVDLKEATSIFQIEFRKGVGDIPDEINIFQRVPVMPYEYDVGQTVVSLTYILFIIPIFFIGLGALIAATSKSSFLRWSGAATLVGGLFSLGIASFAKGIIPWAMKFSHYNYFDTRLEELVFEKTGDLMLIIVDKLVTPVIALSGIICIIGVLIFAFSFTITSKKEVIKSVEPEQQSEKIDVTDKKSDKPDSE